MKDEHRKSIQKNLTSLVEQTDLDRMVTTLYNKGVFSEKKKAAYEDTSKDTRTRKRELYTHIMSCGPQAFELLLKSLAEVGYGDLVRDLVREVDPGRPSGYARPLRNPATISNNGPSRSHESNYVSITEEKKKTKTHIPNFHVVMSTKFHEGDDGFPQYRTRSQERGVLIMFNYTKTQDDKERHGSDVDSVNLKYLFGKLGFKVVCYNDRTQQETLDVLESLRRGKKLHTTACVFVVVLSHGRKRAGLTDVDVMCCDGPVSVDDFIKCFSNFEFPELQGKPKVFIFQMCRGNKEYSSKPRQQLERDGAGDGADDGAGDGAGEGAGDGVDDGAGDGAGDGVDDGAGDGTEEGAWERGVADADNGPERDSDVAYVREYSDILIANSTLPDYVSYRDEKNGALYIQALCQVFAAHAHHHHVQDLFILVDEQLKRTCGQTSTCESWGFRFRLYLNPGLNEKDPAPCT